MPNYRPAVVTDHYCEGHRFTSFKCRIGFIHSFAQNSNSVPAIGASRSPSLLSDAQPYVLTCGHHILPERAIPSLPMPMQRRSEHFNHQHQTFTHREKVRSLIAERVASIEFDTKKRLRAAGENEAKCKVIRIKEVEQRSTISCCGERFSPFMHGLNTIVSISQVTSSLPASFPEPRASLHLPAILTSYRLVMRSSWTGC